MSPVAPPGLRLGSLPVTSPVLVAPMVGITDAPCRRIAREMGAGLVSTEMVPAEPVVRRIPRTLEMLTLDPDVEPVAVQLIGRDPAMMADAAVFCVAQGAQVIDVNLGCPVRKVVNQGTGACLARDIAATAAVLAAIVDAVPVPVTAKMRLGWDSASVNASDLSRALQDVGVCAVTVHGRTRCQGYAGESDWVEIARVKAAVDIPVIGSGDVSDLRLVERRLRAGDVDGVVIARGMLGNFWLIRQAVQMMATGELLPGLDFGARIALARRHLDLLLEHYGEQRALKVGRKYVAWTIRGCNGAARLRAMVQSLSTRADLDEIFDLALHAGLGPEGWFHPVFTSGEG